MAELNDTYVVHTAMIRCSMGMRETYLVLDDTHGVFLRQQPQMTVDDSVGEVNVRCFGGCYSMENPSTKAEADRIQKAVEEECPDTFLDSVLNLFTGGEKEITTQEAQEGVPRIVGVCTPNIPAGTKWDNGKEGVETRGWNRFLAVQSFAVSTAGRSRSSLPGRWRARESRQRRRVHEAYI